MINHQSPPPDLSGAIPLREHPHRTAERRPRLSERSNEDEDDEEDVHPDSDAALLRRHQAGRDESDDGYDVESSNRSNLLTRFIAFMSRTPLLLRSSPAQGTGSYGAVPVFDVEQHHRARAGTSLTGKGKAAARRSSGIQGSLEGDDLTLQRSSTASSRGSRRRRSSEVSDVAVGIDSKSSFATGSGLPGSGVLTPLKSEEHSEEDVLGDEDEDELASDLDEENPPDNSPLVIFISIESPSSIMTILDLQNAQDLDGSNVQLTTCLH